jgi:Xaa-Pro aminopeptidase
VLEPGMVVNVEVPLYELGFGGFQIEDTLLVTETGHEYLIDLDKGLFVIE